MKQETYHSQSCRPVMAGEAQSLLDLELVQVAGQKMERQRQRDMKFLIAHFCFNFSILSHRVLDAAGFLLKLFRLPFVEVSLKAPTRCSSVFSFPMEIADEGSRRYLFR